MNNTTIQVRGVLAHNGEVAVRLQGDSKNPAIVMTHSILSSSVMWDEQAALLAENGWYVVRVDTIGHGDSAEPTTNNVTMDSLGSDTVAVMDALRIEKAHYIGLSLGGMSGFGLGIHHGQRFSSLLLCDARADAPPAVANPWDERIATAEQCGTCMPLAEPTVQRWFGKEFAEANPSIAKKFEEIATHTTVKGFIGSARAIQGLDYLSKVADIQPSVTMFVGSNDGVLPDAMRDLHQRIAGSVLEIIPNAGHLPNIDQPTAFNAALLRHFQRVSQ